MKREKREEREERREKRERRERERKMYAIISDSRNFSYSEMVH